MKRCSFSMYSFLTHGRFVSLRNFISVSNNPMKTLTTQKSIVWSELKYVWVTILKALFVSNNKGKRSPFLTKKMKRCSFGMYSFLTHGHFVSLRNSFLFLEMPEDFDYTEIDCMVRIEIRLSNDSKSVVCF